MSYEIRTNDGTIKVVISNQMAFKIINKSTGSFKDIKFVNRKEKVTVFELQETGSVDFQHVSVPLFPGDRLIPQAIN